MDLPQDIQQLPPSHYECKVRAQKKDSKQEVKKRAFSAMSQLEGWCTEEKASILMDLILILKPQTIVEIGVYGGKSLVPMAYALKENKRGIIYGIDPWSSHESIQGMDGDNLEWWGAVNHQAIYQGLVSKIHSFSLNSYVALIRTTSEQASSVGPIDMLHIDGNHSDETSFLDVTKWVPEVNSGGLIIFDDITWNTTGRAVEWLNENCVKVTDFHEFNDWGIWVKR